MASSNLPPYQPTSKPSKPTTGACISFSRKTTNLYSLVVFLCITSYFLGAWQRGGTTIPSTNSLVSDACSPVLLDINLDFNTHHSLNDAGETLPSINTSKSLYPLCDVSYSEYTPCEDAKRSLRYSRDRLIYRERHCPEKSELLKCRVPAPYGYKNPFAWPKSRDLAWYANVPHKELTVEKAVQNWIRYEGDKFRFPGGGTVEYLESGSRRSSEAFSRSSEYKSESFARRELDRLLEQKQVREVRSMTARLTARAEGSQRASLKEPLDSRLERLRETGTMFPNGANAYINDIGKFINLKDGSIRTAIDTGCGVASWGAYLLSRDILPMSFAPRDTHEAQVQFALERGVPALIGIIASKRLPYPSRAFDVAHCSRCLIPWGQHGGLFLIEVDRVLRPGGYWILSGPPIHWKKYWKGWERTKEDLNAEQTTIENVAKSLCWKKLIEQDDIAIWQKPTNHLNCKVHRKRLTQNPPFCPAQDADKAWYTEMETCLTTLPEVSNSEEIAGGELAKWPERLYAIPPRVSKGTVSGVTAEVFQLDAELWKKRVSYYKYVNQQLGQAGRYRNVLDMNAHLGGFAAALIDYPLWVMNVVPVEAKVNTLGVIYERGLIGTYQNWCEAMSTYPRTYDLIHADSVFSLYKDRCEMEDILLEMDRILRPEGSVIFRDDVDVVIKIKIVIDRLEWDSVIVDHEDGPHQRGKLLLAVKNYWTAPASDQEELQTAIRA